MTSNERILFKNLQTPQEKKTFIEEFWQKRNPNPASNSNEIREEIDRRVEFCNQWFKESPGNRPGWDSDRGRIYIVLGPPDYRDRQEVKNQPYGDFWEDLPLERWVYERHDLTITFIASRGFDNYRLDRIPARLNRVIEEIKESVNFDVSNKRTDLEIGLNCRDAEIDVIIKNKQLFFKETADILSAELVIQAEPDKPSTQTQRPPIRRTVRQTRQQAIENDSIVVTISIAELLVESDLARPTTITVEDTLSKRKGRASCHLGKR